MSKEMDVLIIARQEVLDCINVELISDLSHRKFGIPLGSEMWRKITTDNQRAMIIVRVLQTPTRHSITEDFHRELVSLLKVMGADRFGGSTRVEVDLVGTSYRLTFRNDPNPATDPQEVNNLLPNPSTSYATPDPKQTAPRPNQLVSDEAHPGPLIDEYP